MKRFIAKSVVSLIAVATIYSCYGGGIMRGMEVFHNIEGLSGSLYILLGVSPSDDNLLPPAKIITYNFDEKKFKHISTAPMAGRLVASQDGKWIGLLVNSIRSTEPSRVIVFSGQHKEGKEFKFPPYELNAVIVDDNLYVLNGIPDHQKIDIFNLQSNESSQMPLVGGDFNYIHERMSYPNEVVFGYSPPTIAKGGTMNYIYNTISKEIRHIDKQHLHERSAYGEIIEWKPRKQGWELVARDISKTEQKDRLLRWYRDGSNKVQLSPCLRFALMEKRKLTRHGIESTYHLCELRSGDKVLLLKFRPSASSFDYISTLKWTRLWR